MNPLQLLEKGQGGLAAAMSTPEQQELLVALLTTSCMLELSKLQSSKVELAGFARAAVDILTQFAPIDRCSLHLHPSDLPPIVAAVGDDADLDPADRAPVPDAERTTSVPIQVDGHETGFLDASDVPEALTRARLIEQAAEQIASGLGMMLEAERLRRRAAAARAIELAAALADDYGADELEAIAGTLAALPRAIGARLVLQVPRHSGPIEVDAMPVDDATGLVEGIVHTERVEFDDDGGSLAVTVAYDGTPTNDDVERLTEIVERIGSALSRIERTIRLTTEAETDALTGLANRRRGSKAMAQARLRAEATGGSCAVILVDLDKFKRVNDELGHDVGDAVLVAAARLLRSVARAGDTAVRWGGEELVLVCPGAGQADAVELAERFRVAMPEACAGVVPDGWRQTASAGVAVYPQAADGPDALLRAADKALYEAKGAGRDKVVVAGAGKVSSGTR